MVDNNALMDARPVVVENFEDGMPNGHDADRVLKQACLKCGGFVFEVFKTDAYETSVRCHACGHWFCVHCG
jgi:hypothetical protein